MKRAITPEQRSKALEQASRAAYYGGVLELRAGGQSLAAGQELEALIAKAVNRERVELELELLAYEQGKRDSDGKPIPNRNHVRFRDGAVMRLGRSGKGTPFLRDHDKWNSTSIGGRVTDSRPVKVDDAGHYQIRQTVLLTEPSAVERALRGLMSAVSIGWRPTGPVLCTACNAEVLTECWHFPGDTIATKDGQSLTVEWEYTEAELVETSEVPIGGVPTAELEGIRAALSAAPFHSGPTLATRNPMQDFATALKTKLGLAVTAGEDEILAAVNTLAVDSKELAVVQKELAIFRAEAAIANLSACDEFIASALKLGKIRPNAEKVWRDLFEVSPERAKANMALIPANSETLAGAPRQSAAPEPAEEAKPTTRDEKAKRVLAQHGVDHGEAVKFASAFGARDPKAAIAKHAAGVMPEEN